MRGTEEEVEIFSVQTGWEEFIISIEKIGENEFVLSLDLFSPRDEEDKTISMDNLTIKDLKNIQENLFWYISLHEGKNENL